MYIRLDYYNIAGAGLSLWAPNEKNEGFYKIAIWANDDLIG